jgi:DNA-binding transcriptional ArsR family regulator
MNVCKALSDQTRYQMIKMLLDENRELCICEFEEFFDKDSSVLYRNMKKLEEANLIETEKKGRKRYAKISDRDAVQKLVNSLETLESDLPEKPMQIQEVQK